MEIEKITAAQHRCFDRSYMVIHEKVSLKRKIKEELGQARRACSVSSCLKKGAVFAFERHGSSLISPSKRKKEDDTSFKPAITSSEQESKTKCFNDEHLQEETFSPRKALRIAKLKCRFADTLFKAEQNLIHNGNRQVDQVKMNREKDRFTRKLLKEKEAMEAKVKETAQRKRKIAEERQAARLALEKLEASVYVDDFYKALKDLEELSKPVCTQP